MQFHILSFEGPDDYARAGGIATRISGLAHGLAAAGHETHLWFVGDPDLPGHETHDQLHLHRWCQWISHYHPGGVYDGEEGKRHDYAASLPPFLCQEILLPHLQHGEQAVILAEEWHTVDAVLHLDWRLHQAGVRRQATIVWNANNTFGFHRIAWERLSQAAAITTVSRYMKHLLWRYGVNPSVIPNGLTAEALIQPEREAVAVFRRRMQGRTVLSKVARWDPDKRWLMAIAIVSVMKQTGWKPLFIVRGGMEAHEREVLRAAAAAGLLVTERTLERVGIHGLLGALEDVTGADIVCLRSPLDIGSRQLLFHGSDAVLANSAHEPFGLVGLETMAVGGVACTGASGEDYAEHGHNALVLETNDPQEFIGLFSELRANPAQERALRHAGRATAQQYVWPRIIQRILMPRLRLFISQPVVAARPPQRGQTRLHVHIEGHHTEIPPQLMGWIAERLEDLQRLQDHTLHAHVTLAQHKHWRRCRHEVRVALQLGGTSLEAMHIGKTPYDAVYAALKSIECKLRQAQTSEGVLDGMSGHAGPAVHYDAV